MLWKIKSSTCSVLRWWWQLLSHWAWSQIKLRGTKIHLIITKYHQNHKILILHYSLRCFLKIFSRLLYCIWLALTLEAEDWVWSERDNSCDVGHTSKLELFYSPKAVPSLKLSSTAPQLARTASLLLAEVSHYLTWLAKVHLWVGNGSSTIHHLWHSKLRVRLRVTLWLMKWPGMDSWRS
jgi:hypothetical protein